MRKQNRKDTATSVPVGIGHGVVMSLAVILAGSGVTAKLLDTEKIRWENVGFWVMGILLLASFTGAVTACRKIKRKYMQICLLEGSAIWLILLACTALLFGGQYSGAGVTAILVLGGSCSAGLYEIYRLQKRRPGKKYRNSCKVTQKLHAR